MANKKNKMTISCEVEEEINFKAICDVLNGLNNVPSTINGTHSEILVGLMKKYYKNAFRNLSASQKNDFEKIKATYKQNKERNGLI